MKYVKTSQGLIPMDEYLDIQAIQYGYSNYADLRKHGYIINIYESDIVEEA